MSDSSHPELRRNINLKSYNTLGVEACADYFISVDSLDVLQNVLNDPRYEELPKFILGGGSNILFVNDYPGLVIHLDIQGIEIAGEDENTVELRVGAGTVWHELVMYAVDRGWGGIENLSLIPGRVGAAPIQNIGAYGAELEEVFVHLRAVEIESGGIRTFNKSDCRFGYRDSIFKNELKGRYAITDITIRLSKDPELNTSYGAISEKLKQKNINDPTIRDISDIIIEIRQNKLPDPGDLGNAGSFFKNPVISEDRFNDIRNGYPEVPGYPVDDDRVKVPAGWLIEKTGWKGKVVGNAGTYRQQALVIVNHGGATGSEILELAERIRQSVADRFGIELVPEVNIVE